MREQIRQIAEWLRRLPREPSALEASELPRFLAASDVHGNGRRLAEVLRRAEASGIDHVYLVGDLYAGSGGWSVFRQLQTLVPNSSTERRLTLMWGNHELALVAGMLGNDRQLRFFHSFGGHHLLEEMNRERAQRGDAPLVLSGGKRLTAADLVLLRAQPELREMSDWIQRTHRVFAVDPYGTGYLHAFPKINRHGHFVFEYQGQQGLAALPLIERDLRDARASSHPVFSTLLRTETSPLWALFEITSARQFDAAVRSCGVRQIVFGHRHDRTAVNVSLLNRQIGIAVDFDQGRGGYLINSVAGMTFHRFVDTESNETEVCELVAPAGGLSPRAAHRHDLEEFLFSQFVRLEQQQFDQWPKHSAQARHEFEWLQQLHERGCPWIHRLFAEVYSHVQDQDLRKEMFAAAVASVDEEAFRSFIHLLHRKIFELESYRTDWFSEPYVLAKSLVQVLLDALADMPVARLGLLDMRIRGTTTRYNLTELYKRIMELEDPDLALAAVRNLGTLRIPEANQQLRLAFFHNVRKVRVHAAEALARQGEVAYPLVASLLRSSDNWVRCLALWTIARIGEQGLARTQAVVDIRRATVREPDWFLYMLGKELLRRLGDAEVDQLPERHEIPNLTDAVVATLQEIVECERDVFRQGFRVYYMTVELSSLVYRRGLIGLDIDDLKIYVSGPDYFPPYYRHYKSGDRDWNGDWRGWRRLWIRGETPNVPDGPQVLSMTPGEADKFSVAGRTILIYDYRHPQARVQLPPLDEIIAAHGLGKVKDRTRHALLEQWDHAFSPAEQALLSRLHAAALMKMLFDLPAEIFVTDEQLAVLRGLCDRQLAVDQLTPRQVVTLSDHIPATPTGSDTTSGCFALPQWLDVPKFAVRIVSHVSAADSGPGTST
ncbi:MAG: HEAT repeat domain-containing protein [Pirellulaceae bacterium]